MPLFSMSRFTNLVKVTDNIVMQTFGDRVRWYKTSGDIADIEGIIDEEAEIWGQAGDIVYQGKTITCEPAALAGYRQGETVRALTESGVPTGKTYYLQRTVENDGGLMTVEATT